MVRKKASVKRKSTPVYSRATKARKSSKKHPVHKRVLLHPFFTFILLCVGVLLVMWTFKANAVDIKVTARVAGLPPSSAAEITSPVENDSFSSIPIDITGTCTLLSYVTVYSNNVNLGSALCSLSGDFSLSTTLLPGQNELITHTYNLADEEGPTGTPVNVFYSPFVPPSPTPPPSSPPASPPSAPNGPKAPVQVPKATEPFLISSDFSVRGFLVGDKAEWSIKLTGGSGPYGVNVDWGDGNNSVYSRNKEGDFDISHIYTKAGDDQSMFVIKISASDSDDTKTFLQFFVIINDKSPQFAGSGNGTGGAGEVFREYGSGGLFGFITNNKWLAMALPSYAFVTLMAVSFWLGEKQEYLTLRKHRRLR